jgi:hypothetical protein|eukprot:COSAG02_NODE_352_length_24036_cov_20.479258_14_plen_102_part_00
MPMACQRVRVELCFLTVRIVWDPPPAREDEEDHQALAIGRCVQTLIDAPRQRPPTIRHIHTASRVVRRGCSSSAPHTIMYFNHSSLLGRCFAIYILHDYIA